MSDFDKEAEREKLRKKFAKDEEKRKQTQRMSELLLQGATMTNKHCDRCGDPLFRHNGEEFCPTCRAEGVDDPQSAQPSQSAHETSPADSTTQEPQPGNSAANPAENTETTVSSSPDRSDTDGSSPRDGSSPDVEQPNTVRVDPSRRSASQTDQPNRTTQPAASASGDVDLSAARQSLGRTITKFTNAAEQTDDPHRARDLLEAAREAAETLNTLR